jgi:DNA-binding protein YbaB
MSMQAASLEVLEKANLPAPQARAIVQAIEIEIAGAHNVLATKEDVRVLKDDVHRVELKIEGARNDLRSEIHASARQMYAALLGQMAVLLGIAYFFVTHVKP